MPRSSSSASTRALTLDCERIGCVAEVQIFGDGERLDERGKGNTRSKRGRHPPLAVGQ
ncbi:hypothetical protein [Brucella tritici]|uniref:hypothetical protein n=1 Tax=Brucella tritici TaxID=94626 RepID=UPI003CE5325F